MDRQKLQPPSTPLQISNGGPLDKVSVSVLYTLYSLGAQSGREAYNV